MWGAESVGYDACPGARSARPLQGVLEEESKAREFSSWFIYGLYHVYIYIIIYTSTNVDVCICVHTYTYACLCSVHFANNLI